jgi:hypothetical protein
MAPTETKATLPTPFGVLNLKAAAEASFFLQKSTKGHHQKLYHWLIENYLPDPLSMLVSNDDEPLGRRIRSVNDLSALAVAYSNARALKSETNKRAKMDYELYFYGQLPDASAAREAGNVVQTQFNPEGITGNAYAVHGHPTQ